MNNITDVRDRTPQTGGRSMNLCQIDRAVLAAHEAGVDWRDVRGIRSRARFLRVLARARWRLAYQ